MKKLLLIVALLTISLTFTFAQATVGGWGRGIFVPLIIADGDPTAASLVSWGPGGTRMGFTVSGKSDNVGVQMDVIVDNGAVGVGDQQKIWVKPIEMLTLSAGRIYDDVLRGSASFVAYDFLRYDNMVGDGLIFGRVGEAGQVNFEVALTPVDGAFIFVAFGGNGGLDLQNWMWTPGITEVTAEMFKTGQYGAGYDIPGIGLIRAQLMGMPSAKLLAEMAGLPTTGLDSDFWGVAQAAFKLTMIENLLVDIGATFPTNSDNAGGMQVAAALYAKYIMNTITIHLEGDLAMFDEAVVGSDNTLAFGAALAAEYGLEGGISIQGDVRYRNKTATGYEDGEFCAGAFVKISYSNGIFGVGAQVTNGNFANWGSALVDKTDPAAMVFAIPIRLEYWF
jgi:hypothetical protein